MPDMNRWLTCSNGSRSPVPFSSWSHSSAVGSSAAAATTTRTADVLPWPGIEPMSQLCSIRAASARRPRGSVPNGNGAKMSPPPVRSHGHGAGFALDTSARPTHSSRRPACSLVTGSGHTAPSGRRRPLASCSRRSIDLRRGDAVRQVDLGPPAGAVLADRRRQRRERARGDRLVDLADAHRAQRPDDHVLRRRLHLRGQLGLRGDRLALRPAARASAVNAAAARSPAYHGANRAMATTTTRTMTP